MMMMSKEVSAMEAPVSSGRGAARTAICDKHSCPPFQHDDHGSDGHSGQGNRPPDVSRERLAGKERSVDDVQPDWAERKDRREQHRYPRPLRSYIQRLPPAPGSHHHHHGIFDQQLEGPDQLGAKSAVDGAMVAGQRYTHHGRDL